jgi:DME family drug/metabolite transporter
MNLIRKLPGPLLVFLGACSLSFGGLIVKSFEGATLWQILFWRTVFFLVVISLYLLITYKKKVFKSFYDAGIPGFLGGFVLSFGFCGYVFSMYNTTVANANFIIQTQTIFFSNIWLFLSKRKNFHNNFSVNYFSNFRNIINGWEFFISWTNDG